MKIHPPAPLQRGTFAVILVIYLFLIISSCGRGPAEPVSDQVELVNPLKGTDLEFRLLAGWAQNIPTNWDMFLKMQDIQDKTGVLRKMHYPFR